MIRGQLVDGLAQTPAQLRVLGGEERVRTGILRASSLDRVLRARFIFAAPLLGVCALERLACGIPGKEA